MYTIEDREYQDMAVDRGIIAINGDKKEIIMGPTGSGKSVIITKLCHKLNDRVLILQPNKEILEQNYQKLVDYGVEDIGIYSDSMKRKDISQYTYATIGSIKDFKLFSGFRYCLLDEAHQVSPEGKMYTRFFKYHSGMKVLGLTASPWRLINSYYKNEKGELMYTSMIQMLTRLEHKFFDSICFKITNKTLFDKGYLAPIDYKYPSLMDFSKIPLNRTGSDFDDAFLEDWLNSPGYVTKLVTAITQYDKDLPNNLIFCKSKKHAIAVSEKLEQFGYESDFVWDDDPRRDRKIQAFREGRIKRLLNVNVLSLGFDFPGLYGITLGRPTLSLSLYYQQVGRGIRRNPADPHKRCTVIDACGNVRRFGRIETIRVTKNPFHGRDQVETEKGVISGIPFFTMKIVNPAILGNLNA